MEIGLIVNNYRRNASGRPVRRLSEQGARALDRSLVAPQSISGVRADRTGDVYRCEWLGVPVSSLVDKPGSYGFGETLRHRGPQGVIHVLSVRHRPPDVYVVDPDLYAP